MKDETEEIRLTMQTDITGQGSDVVLVPGGLTGWISWIPHAQQLSSQYRVVRVQLLSVELGLKDVPLPDDYSVDLETDALLRALEIADVERADFVAWSFGALVTLNFALNNPRMVNSLTLIEPPAIWVLESRGPLGVDMLEQKKQLQTLGPGDVSEEQLEWFSHFAGFVQPDTDPRSLPMWPIWVEHRRSLRQGDVVFRHSDRIERVRTFDRPVLLCKGQGSAEFLNEVIDILGEEFPNARIISLPGGHALQVVSMDRFMEILRAFLEEANSEIKAL
jgi:pimeloyl-ACP methyl ester carboxylesterase